MAQGEIVFSLQPLTRLGLNTKDQALGRIHDVPGPPGRLTGLREAQEPALQGQQTGAICTGGKRACIREPKTIGDSEEERAIFTTHANRSLPVNLTSQGYLVATKN